VTPGVRFEHIESNREDRATTQRFDTTNNNALPSLNVAYLVNLALTLFANYGNSFGPVQNLQLNSQTATNPLKPELAKTAEVDARWQTPQIRAELTAFTIRFANQILQVPGSTPAVFQNIGATSHEGIEAAIVYSFDKASALAGLNLYANYSYTKAIQKSGTTAGLDLSFYSRNTDTLGARYQLGDWAFNLASMHQSAHYADAANTVAEPADARLATRPPARSRAAGVRPRASSTPCSSCTARCGGRTQARPSWPGWRWPTCCCSSPGSSFGGRRPGASCWTRDCCAHSSICPGWAARPWGW